VKKEKGVEKEKEIKVADKTEVNDENKKAAIKEPEPSMMRVMQLSKPEWYYIVLGCLASVVSGGVNPAFAIVFSKVIVAFGECPDKQEKLIIQFCLIFLGFGLATFISNFLQVKNNSFERDVSIFFIILVSRVQCLVYRVKI
jgi:hypothetical protein